MAWGKNGTPITLESSANDLDITDLTASKFNQFLSHIIPTGAMNANTTFNNNSNSVYTWRISHDGGTDTTATSQSAFNQDFGTPPIFNVMNVISISGEKKLIILHNVLQNTVGAGTAPRRSEMVVKFVPSPDADITRIDINNDAGGSYDTGSNLSALGSD